MLHDHDLANNLFVRLAITKPHPKHSPLENFCTEALVVCLRNSTRFRKRFVDLCATRPPIIQTGEARQKVTRSGRFIR